MQPTPIFRKIVTSSAIPWRIRNGLETWLEEKARERYPALYRWAHSGSWADPVRALTEGPGHHFFGYYDKSPWNSSGRYLLAHEADFNDRAPNAQDSIRIGVVEPDEGRRFRPIAESHAWNWQQGAMLQWHPLDKERLVVYNERRDGRFVGIVRDVEGGEQRTYERPIYAILPDGTFAYSVSFARLATHRPGYGYAGVQDIFFDDPQPERDGVWRLDLSSGGSELMVSIAELAARDPKRSMEGAWHYINHVQVSPTGKRIAFFHIWHRGDTPWEVRLYTCCHDGSDLRCMLDTGFISHYDWRDDDTILVWANRPQGKARFLMLSHLSEGFGVFAEASVREDGHCSYSPDGAWVLNDTYPDRFQMRTLMLIRTTDHKRIDIARFYSPTTRWWGEIRCDLHPRWNGDGQRICIDSVHEGTRQMYSVDVARHVQDAPNAPRHRQEFSQGGR